MGTDLGSCKSLVRAYTLVVFRDVRWHDDVSAELVIGLASVENPRNGAIIIGHREYV